MAARFASSFLSVDVSAGADQLEKSYGSVEALRGLSLSVPAGCLYGLLGPNGAGKTTSAHPGHLACPDCGMVTVAGINALDNPVPFAS